MDAAHTPERRDFGVSKIGWRPSATVSLMSAAFLVALASAAIILVIFGAEERGTAIALRATARWSFLLFWSAYAGGAIAWLSPRFNRLARNGRELGLSYASAQLIHVGLVFWIIHVATGPSGAMVFFWVGIFCTYLLALFSLQRLRDSLDPRLWRVLRTIALEYIAIAFASDFINLHSDAVGKPSYLPFALMLVSGAGLRLVAFWDRRLRSSRANLSVGPSSHRTLSQLGRMSGEYLLVVWPALLLVAAIVVLLAVDNALRGTLESASVLYGPAVLLVGTYVLLKSAIRGVSLVGPQAK